MPITTILMASSATAADDVAQIDVPDDGFLLGVSMHIRGVSMDVEADHVGMMISFGSTSNFETNDARTVIGMIFVGGSGAGVLTNINNQEQIFIPFGEKGLPVFAGERLHMHTQKMGGADIQDTQALLIFNFRKFASRRR